MLTDVQVRRRGSLARFSTPLLRLGQAVPLTFLLAAKSRTQLVQNPRTSCRLAAHRAGFPSAGGSLDLRRPEPLALELPFTPLLTVSLLPTSLMPEYLSYWPRLPLPESEQSGDSPAFCHPALCVPPSPGLSLPPLPAGSPSLHTGRWPPLPARLTACKECTHQSRFQLVSFLCFTFLHRT